MLAGFRKDLRMLGLFLGREVVPEEGDAKRAVSSFEAFLDAIRVLKRGLHNLCTEALQLLGLVAVDVSSKGTCGKAALGILEDGAHEAATLGAGRADNRNHFAHFFSPS